MYTGVQLSYIKIGPHYNRFDAGARFSQTYRTAQISIFPASAFNRVGFYRGRTKQTWQQHIEKVKQRMRIIIRVKIVVFAGGYAEYRRSSKLSPLALSTLLMMFH